jgi:hypothetical protein
VTAPYQRASVEGILGNQQQRIGALEAVPRFAQYEIKVTSDQQPLIAGDGRFIFVAPPDIDGVYLSGAEAFVTTVSSSALPTIQIRNVTTTLDMLSTRITINVGAFTSYTATTPSVINVANAVVQVGDLIAIDVDVTGTGTKGLGVILTFGPVP